MATKAKATENKEATSNVIVLSNNRSIEIKPTKLKYFTNGDFGMYRLFDEHGLENIIVAPEGKILAMRFLSAVMNKPYTTEQVNVAPEGEEARYQMKYTFDEELDKIFDDELSMQEFKKIIEVAKEVNGITGKN